MSNQKVIEDELLGMRVLEGSSIKTYQNITTIIKKKKSEEEREPVVLPPLVRAMPGLPKSTKRRDANGIFYFIRNILEKQH